ncbi:RAMP superfamily CRISPR-associated protein, partial [Vibrio sp. 10N.222.48.A8]
SVAGSLWVEDADIEYEHIVIRHHNSIDRFTGGVRKGALYSEELLYQPRFTISMYLTKQEEDLEALLLCALNDTIR